MSLQDTDFTPNAAPEPAKRFRPQTALVIAVLVGIALLPVVLILSCTDGTHTTDWTGTPPERITFTNQPRVRVMLASHTRGGS